MEWYEELGFDENPFKKEVGMVGRKSLANEIFYHIEAGNITIVEGGEGAGKTELLKEVIRGYGGNGKVVYVSGKKFANGINIERLINKKYSFLGWLFNKNPRGMILLMDDVESLTETNCERLKYYFDQNYIRSIVFTTSNKEKINFTPSLYHRVRNSFKLEPLTEDEAVEIIKKRIGTLLPEQAVRKLFEDSNNNYRKFLKDCELHCRQLNLKEGAA